VSENTNIEWADHTFNPWEGCQKVGPGCDNCYAETRNARFGGGTAVNWGPGAPRRRTSVANWRKPMAWNRNAGVFYAQHQRRQRVFCASLADVFDNGVDVQWRCDLFDLIEKTPNLDWLLLTKRIGNVMRMITETAQIRFDLETVWNPRLLDNVWLGATIVNQAEADRDIPKLLAVPARVRFLSMEPLLGPVDLDLLKYEDCAERDGKGGVLTTRRKALDWVIVGGESGPNARPMSIQWTRSLRDQCAAAAVPFLFKQWGEWAPAQPRPSETPGAFAYGDYTHDDAYDRMPRFHRTDRYPRQFTSFGARAIVERMGKKSAGRQLDGATHDGFPSAGKETS
jgi:protein gp37